MESPEPCLSNAYHLYAPPTQFSVFLGLIFFLELATGILAFVFKDWIRDQLNLFINSNVKAYRDDIDLQNLIDFAQEYVSVISITGPVQTIPDGHTREGANCLRARTTSSATQASRCQGRNLGEPLSQEKPAPAYSPGFLVPSPVETQAQETAARGGSGAYSAGLFLSLGPDYPRRLCCWCPITEPQCLHDIELPAPFHFQCSHFGPVTGTLRNALLDGFVLVQTSEQNLAT